jgi:hypothetical protein
LPHVVKGQQRPGGALGLGMAGLAMAAAMKPEETSDFKMARDQDLSSSSGTQYNSSR